MVPATPLFISEMKRLFFFFPSLQNWLFSNLSCVNLASLKVSILNKRTVLPERSRLMPVHDKADISRELCV